mmetsp:Transcript_62547/g.146707  ORF Transcript_62547/g.146707 Transcript_62547/m.146707 type:complete len:232 (+) Transcript_62547:1038-1733(+)
MELEAFDAVLCALLELVDLLGLVKVLRLHGLGHPRGDGLVQGLGLCQPRPEGRLLGSQGVAQVFQLLRILKAVSGGRLRHGTNSADLGLKHIRQRQLVLLEHIAFQLRAHQAQSCGCLKVLVAGRRRSFPRDERRLGTLNANPVPVSFVAPLASSLCSGGGEDHLGGRHRLLLLRVHPAVDVFLFAALHATADVQDLCGCVVVGSAGLCQYAVHVAVVIACLLSCTTCWKP